MIIGGAAINRPYAQRTLFVDEGTPYEPGVFYAKDAFEGLSLMDRIIDPEELLELVAEPLSKLHGERWTSPGRQAFSVPDEATDTQVRNRPRGRSPVRRRSGACRSRLTSPSTMSGRTSI